jgi:hypothetical protein
MNCERCGMELDQAVMAKRISRGSTNKNCSDCNIGPIRYVKDSGCRPHQGLVDDDLNPIDDYFQPYRPGVRICGHKDCITSAHIIPSVERQPTNAGL